MKNQTGGKCVTIYSGRFQPFHIGHYKVFKLAQKIFGKDDTYIATSDSQTDPEKSPFKFDDKYKIITGIFKDIPTDHIIKVKNPYQAIEITKDYDPKVDSVIFIVSEKDADRLTKYGKYFKRWEIGEELLPMTEQGYVWIVPMQTMGSKPISASIVRATFRDPEIPVEVKKSFFKELYGKFNEKIFDLYMETFQPLLVESLLDYSDWKGKLSMKNYLLEGGAAGHLMHPWDNLNLTFVELESFINGLVDVEAAEEKVDGQNIMFTVKDGKILFARNKGHLKNYGETALDSDGIKSLFAGRGRIEDAFGFTVDDLNASILKLPVSFIEKSFNNGASWVSLEILYPQTQNVIPYGHSFLLFHEIRNIDSEGNIISYNKEGAREITKLVETSNLHMQSKFKIASTPTFNLKDILKGEQEILSKYAGQLKSLGKSNQTLGEWAHENIFRELQKIEVEHTDTDLHLITSRILDVYPGNLKQLKSELSNPQLGDWLTMIEKNKTSETLYKKAMEPLEKLFLSLGVDILKMIKGISAVDYSGNLSKIKDDVQKTIDGVRSGDDESKKIKLINQLERLESIGGFESIVPIEGLVFHWNGNLYKLTGAFAPVNQILGLLKF